MNKMQGRKPVYIDVEFNPKEYIDPDQCYLPPASQCNIIDSSLAKLNLVRLCSSTDGDCFFTSVAICLRNLYPEKYGTITSVECRKRVADAFCIDMFGVEYKTLRKVQFHMGLQSNSQFYVKWAIYEDQNALALQERKVTVDIISKAISYAMELGRNGAYVDWHVAPLIVASVWNVRVNMHSLEGIPPTIGVAYYYPWGNEKLTNLPILHIVYHTRHFEPAVPFSIPNILDLSMKSLTDNNTTSSTAVTSYSSSSSVTLSSNQQTPLGLPKPAIRISHILGDPYQGTIQPFALYAFDEKKVCFEIGKLSCQNSNAYLPKAAANCSTFYCGNLYICKQYVYSIQFGQEQDDVWFLYAATTGDRELDENKMLGLAIQSNRDISFVLDTETEWLIAIQHQSNTIAEQTANKMLLFLRSSLKK